MMKKLRISLLVLVASVFVNAKAFAHCEVPCGIYDDQLRVEMLYEHFTTIEKAMLQIEKLSAEETVNYNQLVRWINTKEKHANEVQEIVKQYFMTQRIKVKSSDDEVAYKKYVSQLIFAHKMLINAMKTKQTTDVKYVKELRNLLHDFSHVYFSAEQLKHWDMH